MRKHPLEEWEKKEYPKEATGGGWILLAIVVVALVLGFAFKAKAEPRAAVIRGGVICNSVAEVEQYLLGIKDKKPMQQLLDTIDGCGFIKSPVLATMEHVKVFYVDEKHTAHIARFKIGKFTQYGWNKVEVLKGTVL